ncbi:protein FAM8A1 [Lucilia sericata]|uniref:protein FAM8A1 n=1 Tax=Lucilia sericata TaxID=13632 RepID=UPI0018A873F2|nr:protein FAM8A1 [Lucilia sericata]
MSEKEENKVNEKESAEATTTTSSSTSSVSATITTPAASSTTTKPTDVANNKDAGQPREISTKEAYFASLNEWVKHANISQNAMAMFPWYFMTSYPQLFSQPAPGSFMPGLQIPTANVQNNIPPPPLNNNNLNANFNPGAAGVGVFNGFGLRLINDQAQAEIINRNGGYEYVVAPFWKRAVAEVIDMIIMLFLKIVVIFVVTNVFGYNLMMDMDKDVLNKAMDNEDFAGALLYSMDFLAFSSDLLAFEIATKLFVCLYEAVLTTFFNGASVGKHIMGLSIKYVEAMLPLPNNGLPAQPIPQIQLGFQAARVQMRALLFPAETPNFKRAFVRAVAKNVILSLLFPMFFLMVFFKNNRTAYDIMTKTIVVETSSQPLVLRRHPQQQQQQ